MNNSSQTMPTLTNGVGMILGGAIVAVVLLGAVIFIAVMAQKLTGRSSFLTRQMDASKMILPAVGALILGSVSGGVAWSSTLYEPAKVAEPQRVQAAYKKINPIDTQEVNTGQKAGNNGKSVDSIEIAKSVLGSKFDELNKEYDLAGDGDNAKNFSKIEFVPSAEDENKADPCHKIKVSYKSKVDSFDPKAPLVEHSTWVVPDDFDSATCGGEAKEF